MWANLYFLFYDVNRIILKVALLLGYMPASGFKLIAELQNLTQLRSYRLCNTLCTLTITRTSTTKRFWGGKTKNKNKQANKQNRSLA